MQTEEPVTPAAEPTPEPAVTPKTEPTPEPAVTPVTESITPESAVEDAEEALDAEAKVSKKRWKKVEGLVEEGNKKNNFPNK